MNKQNKIEGFIGFYYMEDTSLCDELISLFERSPKNDGRVVKGDSKIVKPEVKVSTEVSIDSDKDPVIKSYLQYLHSPVDFYKEKFKYCDSDAPFGLSEGFNIQMYKPNEGYYAWHTERSSAIYPMNNRHLVFMTYLNDVSDGGETEFYYQKIKVKPEKGLTLIWPADWTHTHRGITSPTQTKYIVTGWLSYV